MDITAELQTKGYCIVPNVLSSEEVEEAKQLFYTWQKTIPDHDKVHNTIDPHGIYKYHQAGHQEHAWLVQHIRHGSYSKTRHDCSSKVGTATSRSVSTAIHCSCFKTRCIATVQK